MSSSSNRSPALKVLQTSPNGGHLVGHRRTQEKNKDTSSRKLTDFLHKIDNDNVKPTKANSKSVDASTITDSLINKRDVSIDTDIVFNSTASVTNRDDVIKMLCNKEPTIDYWKSLAEERRLALDEALLENFELWQQIAFLKEKNLRLESAAKENQELADILHSAVNEADTTEETEKSST